MEQYARFNNEGLLEQTCARTDADKEKLAQEGFSPYEVEDIPTDPLQPFQRLEAKHMQEGGKIVTYFEVVANDPTLIKKQIATLTAQLSATDYKVVKNQEYIAAGQQPYYNAAELFFEREAIRVQIRELENLLTL